MYECECNWLDPEVHPQTEDYWGRVNPIGTRACHDEGKRISETLSYAYQKQVFTRHLLFLHYVYSLLVFMFRYFCLFFLFMLILQLLILLASD